MVYSAVLATHRVMGSSPQPEPMLVDKSANVWIQKVWLPCLPLYSQQVLHQRWIWESHKWESMQLIYPGFESQGRHHQKSKTGVSVVPRKGLMSSKKKVNIQESPTTCCVASARYAALSYGGGGVPHPVMMGVPHPVMVGGSPSSHGGTPSSHGGVTPGTPPGQTWDGVPPTIQTWPGGVP